MRWASRIVAASGLLLFASCSAGSDDARSDDARTDDAQTDGDTGRLIVQSNADRMDALFEATLIVAPDGCTYADDGQQLDVIWPLGTRWVEAEQAVLLADGNRLVDGTEFRTGGGAISVSVAEMRSGAESGLFDEATVTDETVACLVNDEVLVIGDFETVIDR